jgi:hypothetical protein
MRGKIHDLETNVDCNPIKPMGINAGITYHFVLSSKLRCADPLTIFIDNIPVSKRVYRWIEEYPELIWSLIYNGKATNPRSLSLCRDALDLLKSRIMLLRPELLDEIKLKKKKYAIRRRCYPG